MVSLGLETVRSGMRSKQTGQGSQLGRSIRRSTRGRAKGGRSGVGGRSLARTDGRPTMDGDIGLSLDGRTESWLGQSLGRSLGRVEFARGCALPGSEQGAGHLEVLG